jgi:FKBP-type peptidyl-prolyl cis-trans isomerase
MKNYKSLVLLIALVIGVSTLSSCQKTKVTEKDAIEFTYIKEGTEKPANGDYLLFNLEVLNLSDSVLISSLKDPLPQNMQGNDTIKAQSGIEEIIFGLKKGDSIQFQLAAKFIYGENPPPGVKVDEILKVRIGAFEIKNEAEMQTFYQEAMQKEQAKAAEHAKARLLEEAKTIEAYLTKNNLKAEKTQSGLYYVIEKEGTGEATTPGTTLYVNYAGYLLDGPLFDTSWPEIAKANNKFNPERLYAPLDVNVGMGQVIPGWDEGLMLLKKGTKAKLIIPSPLGYGEQGEPRANIPANSILVFDVEVTDVQK